MTAAFNRSCALIVLLLLVVPAALLMLLMMSIRSPGKQWASLRSQVVETEESTSRAPEQPTKGTVQQEEIVRRLPERKPIISKRPRRGERYCLKDPEAKKSVQGCWEQTKPRGQATSMWFLKSSPALQIGAAFFSGGVEGEITSAFNVLLDGGRRCHRNATVLDIGGNTGWFTSLSTMMNCTTVTVEPQPNCRFFIQQSLWLNRKQDLATVFPGPILPDSAKSGEPWKVNKHHCAGGFNKGETIVAAVDKVPVPGVFLEDMRPALRGRTIPLAKIDTEGGEIGALKALWPLIKDRQIENMVIEVVPAWWPRAGQTLEEGVTLMSSLSELYDCYTMSDQYPPEVRAWPRMNPVPPGLGSAPLRHISGERWDWLARWKVKHKTGFNMLCCLKKQS